MRIGRPIVLALFLALLLGACVQGIGAAKLAIQTDAEFNQIFLKDVQQAIALAEATDDRIALKCWTYLEQFTIDNTPSATMPEGEVAGVLAVYQKARNLRRTVIEVEISDAFRLECGPMLIESMGVLGRLGIRIVL